ncbi:MAG: GtrA family protein [Prolixibacteraceae bacterium]|nr:GtrA family protein [Prolixibacteraceae bacterium]
MKQKILNNKIAKELLSPHFIKYALIGLTGVALDFIVYSILIKVFNVNFLTANFIAISFGIINNFVLNTLFNFKTKNKIFVRFVSFYAVGLLGLLLSEILLIIFVLIIDSPIIAKVLTLPIVLVFQYGFNKYFSFSHEGEINKRIKRLFIHWPLLALVALFTFVTIYMASTIPMPSLSKTYPASAPDETTHWSLNVKFYLDNKRLPVSGEDDLSVLSQCRDNQNGKVSCLYSYQIYPPHSYIIAAMFAKTAEKVGYAPELGARGASIFFGLISLICAYFTAFLITRSRSLSSLLGFTFMFIPQVLFTSSYINLDAYSFMCSMLLALGVAWVVSSKASIKSLICVGVISGGLIPTAKPNYFLLSIFALALSTYLIRAKKGSIFNKKVLYLLVSAILGFILISAFWYTRNYILYHDLLGQDYVLSVMAKYHELGSPIPFSIEGLSRLINMHYFDILLRSFIANYGGMTFPLKETDYSIIQSIWVVAGGFFAWCIYEMKDKKARISAILASITFVLLFVGLIFVNIYNSMVYDYQPQGRYMFPLIGPLIILLAVVLSKIKKANIVLFLLASATLYAFISGMILWIGIYVI